MVTQSKADQSYNTLTMKGSLNGFLVLKVMVSDISKQVITEKINAKYYLTLLQLQSIRNQMLLKSGKNPGEF